MPMSGTFDASLKELIERYPADWLALTGRTASGAVQVIDADLSTVSAAADKVIRVPDSAPWLLHLEMQSSPKSALPRHLHWYNALLGHRHELRVRTVLVLLRPAADSPQLDGIYREQFPGEAPYLEFRYTVLRVWRMPAESFLTGPLGTLPLAPISAATEAELPGVVRRLDERLENEASPEQRQVLGTAAMLLTGLRLPQEAMLALYQGVHFMSILKDSSFYQMILDEGRLEGRLEGQLTEARALVLRLGQTKLGPPDEAFATALQGIADLGRLERMLERLWTAVAWQDLLAAE
jgi:predicted transposase YdaD